MTQDSIRLFVADVDGTLVTQEKVLTKRAIDAVRALGAAGVIFAVTSGRPPRGMSMLIEPLQISTPVAAFNGGLIVEPDMTVIEQKVIPQELVAPTLALMESHRPVYVDLPGGRLVRDRSHRTPREDRRRIPSSSSPPWWRALTACTMGWPKSSV